MPQAVICMLKTQLQAETMITRLRAAGLQIGDISVMFLERNGVLGLARDRDSQLTGGRLSQAVPSGPVGGVLGMLSGIGIATIPGAGLHITAGPIIAALCGGKGGAVVSTVAEALVSMGWPMTRARHYEDLVKLGNILLAVQAWQADEVAHALAVLHAAHGEDISVADELQFTGIKARQAPVALS